MMLRWGAAVRALLGLLACLWAGTVSAQADTPVLDADAQAWLTAQGPIRLAPDPDFAPVDFLDVRGRHRGLSADLWAILAQRTGMKTQIVRKRRFEEALQALRAGDIDVASSVYKSPARAQALLFSNSYLRLPAALIAPRDVGVATQLSELRGRPIAVVQGHVWQELLSDAGYARELRPAASIKLALTDVAEGRADVYIGDLLTADPVLRKSGLGERLRVAGPSGLEAEIAFAIRADLPQLKRVLDQALASVTVAEEAALRARWEGPNALADPEQDNEVPASRAAELGVLKAAIESAEGLADADRAQLLQRVETALADDARADADIERVERLARELESVSSDRIESDEASAAEELLRWRGSLPQRATPTQLEQLLLAEQSTRASLQETVTRLAQRAQELQQRPVVLRAELGDLRSQLDALQVPESSDNLAARTEREAALARERALRAGIYAGTAEQANLDVLQLSVEQRKRERQRALAQRSERVRVLEELIAERRDHVLEQYLARLRAVARQYESASPAIRDLAAENLVAGQELATRTRRLAILREQSQQIEAQSDEVRTALENARARIAIGGVTEAVGMLLLAERRRLPNPPALRAQLNALQSEVAEVQLAQISVSEERDRLADLGQAVARLAGSDVDTASALNPEQRSQLTELLLSRLELLPQLSQLQQKSREVLEHSEQQLVQLLDDSQTLVRLMEQNLLWVPSHRPIDSAWWKRLQEGWSELARPDRWSSSVQRLIERLPQHPLWILALMAPWALLLTRPALGRRLQALASTVRDVRADRMRYTLQAGVISVVLALPMALFWWLLGSMLIAVGEAGRFTHSLGIALHGVVPILFVLTSISVVCREYGLAHAHLRWPRARRYALLRMRPWLYFLLMPLLFLTVLSLARDIDGANGTVLRSTLVLVHVSAAMIVAWLLGPNRLLASRVSGADPWPRRRQALRLLLVGGFLTQAVLALMGYVFTSSILLVVSLNTLQVLYAVALVHGLVLRWLVIGERRVALAQQLQSNESGSDSAGLDVPVIAPDTVNLRAISEQSRSLLRALTLVALATGLLWSLADVAPAFALLDQVTLWQSSEMVDGVAQARTITLGDALLALAALLVGIIAARNIPGLLEIVLLKRFTEDASVRYAVVTVTRYLISFLMVVAVFGLLGVRWGHLQWLAAGFSVGLGFGLQEIFGNFVAGLILLFERPFRVGDVVTIGDLTGTVRRVRTRATTIVDFDNKDIVIPNKTFITERFVNWTLTDTTTRLILRVGVGYESQPEQVRETLLEIARRHPAVLAEPPPVAVFMLLADSTLNFELRCFVGAIADRLKVTDEIHSAIVHVFRERGIRMAYPQMDVHVHQSPASNGSGGLSAVS